MKTNSIIYQSSISSVIQMLKEDIIISKTWPFPGMKGQRSLVSTTWDMSCQWTWSPEISLIVCVASCEEAW